MKNKIKSLSIKGVKFTSPDTVEIGNDVDIRRISGDNVIIYGGCRIYGLKTWISKGCSIGKEGPVTIENCWIGPDVKIHGGYAASSVFLSKTSLGNGAHVREGCILEEESSIAHNVGLKQTILFPFVTLGSLINFCDCFMAGGTDRKNHSEVGSSYIHFNYTPNQDKATASLLGDVPSGVMLNRNPIFLGGQGGLVGPCRLNFGTVIAAGTIQRKDEIETDRLLFGGALRAGNIRHVPGRYQNINRVITNNMLYIANLVALYNWYGNVRVVFISDSFPYQLLNGLMETLELGINERMKRLKDFLDKALACNDESNLNIVSAMVQNWDGVKHELYRNIDRETVPCEDRFKLFSELFNNETEKSGVSDYIYTIKNLSSHTSEAGTSWLYGIVEEFMDKTLNRFTCINS